MVYKKEELAHGPALLFSSYENYAGLTGMSGSPPA